MSTHKKLIVWQKAHELAIAVYRITEAFPRHEQFGITSQLRRATLSIPTNIVEGYSRESNKEFIRFIDIARGSLAEAQYLLEFAKEIGYSTTDITPVENLTHEVGKLLWSFQQNLKNKSVH
ncbi:MAG: four helix bundle protein [Nitrospirae bacterium]|nr:four helix bundle protein [Nitrospirota bacterium]